MNDKYILYHGDCLEEMNKIPDKSIDMILCDLPYGLLDLKWDVLIPMNDYIIENNKIYYKNEWILKNYKENTNPYNYNVYETMFEEKRNNGLWFHYERIIKDIGCIVLFGVEPFSSYLRESNKKLYKYDLYWKKERPTNIMNLKNQFGKVIETISIFGKSNTVYNPIMENSWLSKNRPNCKNNIYNFNKDSSVKFLNLKVKSNINYNPSIKYPTNLLQFSRNHKSGKFHPTQKPIPLLEYLIKTFTNENDLVLDNTMGSGSTGVACLNTNRKFIGIEKDNNYFNIAKKRIENVQGIW